MKYGLLHLIESEIMEEKKNIRELAIQYFEGRILRKDEKLLFAYVGQSEENRATFRPVSYTHLTLPTIA
mgnify:CR=1 FL=1